MTTIEILSMPRHVAIIMDGNGRWAKSRFLERVRGHEKGAQAVREVTTACRKLGIEALSLYAFSEENWSRPKREVDMLMRLLERFLVEERRTLMDNRVQLLHVGRREKLSAAVLDKLDETIALTAANKGMKLGLAISYGGRAEIVDAVRRIADAVRAGTLDPIRIDEDSFRTFLYHPEIPDPDLLIRTAGEMRVSNFLLWQISYAELHVEPVCWPDFRKDHLHAAFRSFAQRVRKFGAVVP